MTSCHLIPTWHEWNVNANDVMMAWFALDVNFVMLHLACAMHAQMHGTYALNKYDACKYPSGLACM